MGYGYRWLAPRDAMYVEDAMDTVTCPIVRQMLGATTQNSGLYHGNGRKNSICSALNKRSASLTTC